MTKIEKKLFSWADNHMPLILIVVVSILGIIIRWPMRDYVSWDSYFYLLPWYEEIKANGLGQQVGNYNLLYQLLIALLGLLPLKPLYAYKLLSVVFDYALAVGAGMITYHICEKDRMKGTLAFCLVVLSPVVAVNSSTWAQCDSIYTCFAIFGLLCLMKERHLLAMIMLGLSFAFKLQAVFMLPVFLFVYYARRRFPIYYFLLIPLTMLAVNLPLVFFGRNLGDVFTIYQEQMDTYSNMAANYPSPWLLLVDATNDEMYELMKVPAIMLTVAALGGLMLYWHQKKTALQGKSLLIMAFLLCYTCVLFLPSMHERYGYPYEILAIIVALLVPKTAPLCVGVVTITMCSYGPFLFSRHSISFETLTIMNIAIYVAYVYILCRELGPVQPEKSTARSKPVRK